MTGDKMEIARLRSVLQRIVDNRDNKNWRKPEIVTEAERALLSDSRRAPLACHAPSALSGAGSCPPGETSSADLTKALAAVSRSLVGAISIIEHTPECKKAMPSDKMFDQMLADMKRNLEQANGL